MQPMVVPLVALCLDIFAWPCITRANYYWVVMSAAWRSTVSPVMADILPLMIYELALLATWMLSKLSLMD